MLNAHICVALHYWGQKGSELGRIVLCSDWLPFALNPFALFVNGYMIVLEFSLVPYILMRLLRSKV